MQHDSRVIARSRLIDNLVALEKQLPEVEGIKAPGRIIHLSAMKMELRVVASRLAGSSVFVQRLKPLCQEIQQRPHGRQQPAP